MRHERTIKINAYSDILNYACCCFMFNVGECCQAVKGYE